MDVISTRPDREVDTKKTKIFNINRPVCRIRWKQSCHRNCCCIEFDVVEAVVSKIIRHQSNIKAASMKPTSMLVFFATVGFDYSNFVLDLIVFAFNCSLQ